MQNSLSVSLADSQCHCFPEPQRAQRSDAVCVCVCDGKGLVTLHLLSLKPNCSTLTLTPLLSTRLRRRPAAKNGGSVGAGLLPKVCLTTSLIEILSFTHTQLQPGIRSNGLEQPTGNFHEGRFHHSWFLKNRIFFGILTNLKKMERNKITGERGSLKGCKWTGWR